MEQLKILKQLAQLDELREYIRTNDYIAYDVETTGTGREAKVIGFSVCADLDLSYYVILRAWNPALEVLEDLETLPAFPELVGMLVGKKLIGHNFVFDAAQTEVNAGVSLIESCYCDTMVLAHLLDENRPIGLKDKCAELFGEDAKKEQAEMKASIAANGGALTKKNYELFKADADLIARYGAKDGILTLKLFYTLIPRLYEEGLDKFFFDEESMLLLRGPTYELNTVGLKVDLQTLEDLKRTLEAECLDSKSFIYKEIDAYVKDKYPGTNARNTFNIGASQQLSWLLYFRLGNMFETLTDGGKALAKALGLKMPYSHAAKREFLQVVSENKDRPYKVFDEKKKVWVDKKVGDPWKYIACGAEEMAPLARKYRWVATFLAYAKNQKILNTYVKGIQERQKYGIIRPSFKQCGTDSGRYSSSDPNFQNLPRKEKRVKSCIVSRPGKTFVGADYSQLEPRVFASFSRDARLCQSFANGEDFYAVVGSPVFGRDGVSLIKGAPDSFDTLYPEDRDKSKIIALSAPYGTTAFKMASALGCPVEEAQDIIDRYFSQFPDVQALMLSSHEAVKRTGRAVSLFGRVRRVPEAMEIPEVYGRKSHAELPYVARSLLNLGMNFPIQSTGASIVNRAAIAFYRRSREEGIEGCHIVMNIHDELVVECFEQDAERVVVLLKDCMENTSKLPGVDLVAEPKVAKILSNLK